MPLTAESFSGLATLFSFDECSETGAGHAFYAPGFHDGFFMKTFETQRGALSILQ
jgi:hypothetical protein